MKFALILFSLMSLAIVTPPAHAWAPSKDPKDLGSADSAIRAFLEPLAEKGAAGLDKAWRSVDIDIGGDGSNGIGTGKDVYSSIKNALTEGGKVLRAERVSFEPQLKGAVVQTSYRVFTAGGQPILLEMTLYKPSDDEGYHLVKIRKSSKH